MDKFRPIYTLSLRYSSCNGYHCKRGMADSQALRLNSIYSKNESFDIDCNYLEIEKIDNDQIIKKKILKKMMFAKISINVKERYLVDKIYPGCFEIC